MADERREVERHHRSPAPLWAEDRGDEVIQVLEVPTFGALVLRASGSPLEFKGLSIFYNSEIGWRD